MKLYKNFEFSGTNFLEENYFSLVECYARQNYFYIFVLVLILFSLFTLLLDAALPERVVSAIFEAYLSDYIKFSAR